MKNLRKTNVIIWGQKRAVGFRMLTFMKYMNLLPTTKLNKNA